MSGEMERKSEDSTSLPRECVSSTHSMFSPAAMLSSIRKLCFPALLPRAQGLIWQMNHPYYTLDCSKRGEGLSFAFYKSSSRSELDLLCSVVSSTAAQPGAQT